MVLKALAGEYESVLGIPVPLIPSPLGSTMQVSHWDRMNSRVLTQTDWWAGTSACQQWCSISSPTVSTPKSSLRAGQGNVWLHCDNFNLGKF